MDADTENEKIVATAFANWAAGRGSFLDIVHDDVEWTIVGTGPSAGTFHGRDAFVEQAYAPLTDRLTTSVNPTVLAIFADGDRVCVLWNGEGLLRDGQTYRNSYAWFLTMRDGKAVAALAFLDLATFDAGKAGAKLPQPFVAAG